MISRIADHCFWFGRYLERAESTARVLHVTANLALDTDLTQAQCWEPILIASGQREHFAQVSNAGAEESSDRVQEYMAFAEDNTTSLLRSIAAARDNARSIREVVSLEVWQTMNELFLWMTSSEARRVFDADRYGFYRRVRQLTQLALGMLQSTMLHDAPLDFIWLGVLLERAGQTARTLDINHSFAPLQKVRHPIVETALWLSLLRACSGFEPFMKRHQGRVSGEAASTFLLLEPSFPRSVRFCVRSADEHLTAIRSPVRPGLPGEKAQTRLRLLEEWLVELTPSELRGEALHGALENITKQVDAISGALGEELLGHGPPPGTGAAHPE